MHLKRLFYLSYEDALWDILKKKNVRQGTKILVPDFFCRDVEENIKNHNYKVVYYHIKKGLSADIDNIKEQITKHKPSVVIVFHPVGITSNLFKDRGWIKFMDNESILIEDCVHRIINPSEIVIYKHNHFLINSLRKVAPLQGASVYGLKDDLNFDTPPFTQSIFYSLKVNLLWLLMDFSSSLRQFNLAEKLMIKGYNLIGDSILPAKGFFLFKILEEFLDYDKISKIKINQAVLYENMLKAVTRNTVAYKKSDFGNMHAWPIILDGKNDLKVLEYIRSKGLIIRFELEESIWSKNKKILYLPMEPHINYTEQMKICQIVSEALILT